MPKSLDNRISELQTKISQLKAQEKALKARKTEQERKARTKRLIEIGATVESVLGRPITKEDLPNLKRFLQEQEDRGNFFSNAMKRTD